MKSSTGPMAPQAALFDDRSSITEVPLPTLGKPYKDAKGGLVFPSGSVRISSMTVAEEKMMAQKTGDASRKINSLLAKVCDLRGMRPDQLLVCDQFYLLMKVRSVSYGNKYGFQFRCEDCKHQWNHEINLETDIPISVVDDEWNEPFILELPSGKVIHYRLLRSLDEIELNNRKIKDESNDPTFVSMLARSIISVDGQTLTGRTAEAWLEKQSVRDRGALTASIDSNTPGYTGRIQVECPSCGYRHEAVVPMTSDFFRPDVSE